MDQEHQLEANETIVYTTSEKDATQGVDNDPSINTHTMVKKMSCGCSKNCSINLLSKCGVHMHIY
jgi:hypothetical protein